MTHYEPDPTARRKDRIALECIMNLDAEGLVKIVKRKYFDVRNCTGGHTAFAYEENRREESKCQLI